MKVMGLPVSGGGRGLLTAPRQASFASSFLLFTRPACKGQTQCPISSLAFPPFHSLWGPLAAPPLLASPSR